jgi:hypothetical protein
MTEEILTTPAREPGRDPRTQDPCLWRDDGWTARVIKNIDDDGWAAEMIKDGEPEPALTGPWTMGRDKKNPKPLDATAFATLVKTSRKDQTAPNRCRSTRPRSRPWSRLPPKCWRGTSSTATPCCTRASR